MIQPELTHIDIDQQSIAAIYRKVMTLTGLLLDSMKCL